VAVFATETPDRPRYADETDLGKTVAASPYREAPAYRKQEEQPPWVLALSASFFGEE